LGDLCIFEADEARDRGSCQVDVEDAHRFALEGECQRELEGDRGFSDASFAGENLERNLLSVLLYAVSRCRRYR
jgi:hypothetical protein